MSGTEGRKARTKKRRTGTVTVLQVNNIPWDLYDRIGQKAAAIGKGRDEWIREVMERETAKGIRLQREWKREQRRHDAQREDSSGTSTGDEDTSEDSEAGQR
jgi:hypothetical protein